VESPVAFAEASERGPRLRAAGRGVHRVFSLLAHDSALAAAVAALGLLVFLAVLGPLIWTKNATAVDVGSSLLPPSRAHPMGTDSIGRDVFARFNEGARISLAVGVAVVVVGAVLGGVAGIVAGASPGWVDATLMRIMDAILAFPPLILAMAVTVGLGAGLETAALGIMLTSLPYYARLLRSEVLRIRSLPFIEAAHALGARQTRIMARHIVPHVMSTLLIQAAAVFGYAILTLAALGFVGLGAQVPTPEWGTMITDGLQYFLTGQWWIGVFPGLGVLLAVTATSVIADRTRDNLDPRGRYAHV
jgi:peptide/nickel transport system permease protein